VPLSPAQAPAEQAPGTVAPTLSVVVASFRARAVLEQCLAALERQLGQAGVELIVARPASLGDLDAIARAHPNVRVVGSPAEPVGAELPRVRGAGLSAARGSLVALTEDHCAPANDWIARLLEHARRPVDVLGGAMDNAQRDRAVDWGAFFAEYGFFAGADGVPLVTGANVAYGRAVVDRVASWSLAGAWENVIHARLAEAGARLEFDPSLRVLQLLSYGLQAFCGDRYRHGFDYARVRLAEEHTTAGRRLVRAATAPLLPPVLAWRIGRRLRRPEQRSAFRSSLPFTLTFLAAWSVGECLGYLRGPAR
jgi:GT2 family glycosyltransferase